MSIYSNERLEQLNAYTPGEQPTDKRYIKLNTNESPYLPSVNTIKAASYAAKSIELYPDPECIKLRKKIAELYNVDVSNVFVSNGSDDILNFAFAAFPKKGEKAVFADITYGFYEVFAQLNGVQYAKIPLSEKLELVTEDYYNAQGTVFIANPNAPTGIAIEVEKIEKILVNNPNNVVVIDEAYIDFGAKSCVELIKKYKNLLVVQTFSKSRSMAGGRLGFAIADSELINDLCTVKFSTNPYSVNSMTMAAGIAAIDDNDYYMDNCKRIIKNREWTDKQLQNLGFCTIKSSTNFIFAKSDKISGKSLYEELKKRGILVRHFENPRITDFVRITIGSEEQMKKLTEQMKLILEEKKSNEKC